MSDDLPIHALGPKGDGIHTADGGAIYVDRALPGDVVQAKVQRGSGGVLRGEILRVVTPSPHRVAAPCPNFNVCGGCTLPHADPAFYRDWKIGIVRDALAREDVLPEVWHDPVFVPPGTRRRVTFAAYKKGNRVTLGYFRRRTHMVTDIATCLVADPAIMDLRAKLSLALVPLLQDGKTTDVFLQSVRGQTELVITGPIGKKGPQDLQVHEAIAALAQALKLARISWRARDRDEPEVMLEVNPLRARFGALDVNLPPLAFLQPTQAGEDALAAAVMAPLPKKGTFADLFCGSGTFSGPMLDRGPVDAFDNGAAAIRALEKSRGPRPLHPRQRDLFKDPLYAEELKRYDAVVFDPPRAGADAQAMQLAASEVPLIVGVSCDPRTFACDARILTAGGYTLESAQVIDQFTWSHHVELAAIFRRR